MKKCVIPDTRPGVKFNEEGICSACEACESGKLIDWDAHYHELKVICDKYRGINDSDGFDCVIVVSGGKDSSYQVYVMKELMGMNPMLFLLRIILQ